MTAILYAARGGFGTTSDLYTLNPATGVETSVGPIGFGVTGLAFDPTDGTLYGSTSNNSAANPKSLLTIDPVTGAGTLVAAFGGGAGVAIPDLAFDSTGQLWGWRQASNKLTAINKATAGLTDLGASGLSTFGGGTSFDSGDVCYTFQNGSLGNYYTVNTSTGATTLAGALVPGAGITSGAVNAAAFDSVDLLWAIVKAFKLVTINVATGAETLIGNMAGDETWDALAWAISAAPAPSFPPVRVGLAFTDPALEPTPTWTYLDVTSPVHVQDIHIKRGKADEREKTPTGTATISGIDTGGILDPTNATGPYYGNLDPMKQIQVILQHPVSLDYFPIFTGFLSELGYEVDPSEKFASFTLECEDALAIFADAEVIPDVAGNTVPAESTGDVYYSGQQVDDRIKAALADAALSAGVTEWPSALMNIFSGNVSLQGSVYSARSPILGVLQEAAEGEYAGIPQLYVDKQGVVCFRGRQTRFDPDTYHPIDNVRTSSETILYWKIGDRAALAGDADTVLIAEPFRFSRSKADLINCALCAPRGIAEAAIAGQFVTDATSVAAYGARSIGFENLITEQGDEVSPLGPLPETKLFATYYVDNYKVPHNRPGQVTIKGQDPASPTGPNCWDLLCNIDLGDLPTLTTTHPGGGGFAGIDHFSEGLEYTIVPQVATHPEVTLVCDLVPRAYFATDPFPAHA